MSEVATKRKQTPAKQSAATKNVAELKPGEYNQLVECATLEEIRLVNSTFFIAPEYFDDSAEGEKKFRTNQKADKPVFHPESSSLVTGFEYSIEVFRGEERVLTCSAHYIVFFSFDSQEPVDEEVAKYFAHRTGRNAAYPYFRQYAASQSWASGANLPVLPILKSAPVSKTAPEKKASKKSVKKKLK